MFDITFSGIIVLYLIAGAAAGASTGFLGGGGGVITVPILIYVFTLLGYPEGASVHTAIGTSLFVIFFNAATSSLIHLKKGIIHHRILIVMVISGILGAVAGGTTSAMTAGPILKKLLGAFLILTAIRFMRTSSSDVGKDTGTKKTENAIACPVNERRYSAKAFILCGFIGLFSGFVASFFGIGGGAITIPLGIILVHFSMIEAICYSTCLMTVCTVVGVVVQIVAGLSDPQCLPYSIGYVNYVAGIVMVLSGTYTARWAARKVHVINQVILMRIITVIIIIAAIGLLIK